MAEQSRATGLQFELFVVEAHDGGLCPDVRVTLAWAARGGEVANIQAAHLLRRMSISRQ